MKKLLSKTAALLVSAAMMVSFIGCGSDKSGNDGEVKVGLLHSMSGSMAISEQAVLDAEKLAIKEINAAGGVLGCQIKYQEEDGASDPSTFATKAENSGSGWGFNGIWMLDLFFQKSSKIYFRRL